MMDLSEAIAAGAMAVSLAALAFSLYVFRQRRVAKLEFRMSIGRSYSISVCDEAGQPRRKITAEHNPTTNLLIRNLSSRPSAIVEIRAKNSAGAILMDIERKSPGGQMPIKIDPWGVEIVKTTWAAGKQTDGMFFEITDIDDYVHTIYDYTGNKRLSIGEDPLYWVDLPPDQVPKRPSQKSLHAKRLREKI